DASLAGTHGQLAQDLTDLHDRIGVVNLHHKGAAVHARQRAACGLSLAVAEGYDRVYGSEGMHDVQTMLKGGAAEIPRSRNEVCVIWRVGLCTDREASLGLADDQRG